MNFITLITIAPIAWNEFLQWTNDQTWYKYWRKSENAGRIGRYSKKDKTFTLSWALYVPLYGLKDFVVEDSKGWSIKYLTLLIKKNIWIRFLICSKTNLIMFPKICKMKIHIFIFCGCWQNVINLGKIPPLYAICIIKSF